MVAQTELAAKPSTTLSMDINFNLSQGAWISNKMPVDEAAKILAIAAVLGHYSLKEGYAKVLTRNPNQRLRIQSNIVFGRGQNHIWFAHCDSEGKLLPKDEPIAAIFFNG